MLETSKICENTKKRKKCSESSENFQKLRKKVFFDQKKFPGSSGGRAPKFRGVPGRSDFKHSFGKGSSGEFRGDPPSSGEFRGGRFAGTQKTQFASKTPPTAKFSEIRQNRQICENSRIFALQCLGAAKASGPEIRALPFVSFVFSPVAHGSDESSVESTTTATKRRLEWPHIARCGQRCDVSCDAC